MQRVPTLRGLASRVMLCVIGAVGFASVPAIGQETGPYISEFMALNDSTRADEDEDYADWIEIHNPSAAAVNLGGWYLTDKADNLDKWQLPSVTVPAGGYLLVFASGKDRAVADSELHTNFRLNGDGEYLALIRPDGITVAHEFAPEFPRQLEDVSYGLGITSASDVTFIPSGAIAAARVPTGPADENVWMLGFYDDSGWPTGPTAVGYDEAETYDGLIGLDVEAEMNGINESVWVRIPFTVDDPAMVLSMTLRMKYDDGFVAFINGQLVAADNAGAAPPLAYDAGASGGHSDSDAMRFVDFNVSAIRSALVAGENLLAIHGLNHGLGSSDMLILPELIGSVNPGGQQADLRYFTAPTPGAANNSGVLGYIDDVDFSVPHGFYDGPFSLALASDTPDVTLRYTLDGTEPTSSHGSVYTGPIAIATTTVVRAAAFKPGYLDAEPVTHTYIFLADVLAQTDDETARDFPDTWYAGASNSSSYDRRSRPADYEMDPDVVGDPRMITALTSIPTVALTFDPHDLWDAYDGMYPNSIMRASSNIFWEKPTSMELIDPAGLEEGFSVNAAGRILGELARWPAVNDKQSFRVLFKGDYGPSKLDYPFFGDGVDRFDTIVLRANWGDGWLRDPTRSADINVSFAGGPSDNSLYLRDIFLHDAFRDTGNVGVRGRFVHLYLNGVYWGLFEAIERPDDSFAAEHFGGNKDEYDVIKGASGAAPENGALQEGDRRAYNYMLDRWFDCSSSGYGSSTVTAISDAELAALEEYLDVDQFIDYMITLWTYNRQDFPRKNWYMVCRRNPAGGPPLIPFTCHTWDSEAALGQGVGEASNYPDSTEVLTRWNNTDSSNDTGPVRIYRRLITNATFRRRWADRAQQLMLNDGPLSPDAGIARFNARADEIDTAIIGESARWGDSMFEWNDREGDPQGPPGVWTRDATWMAECDRIRTQYLPQRTGYVIEQMRSVDLFPSIDAPEFNRYGGEYAPGFELVMTNPNGTGMVYYTLDGTDPRTSPSAMMYVGSPVPLAGAVVVKAAVVIGPLASAVVEAGFMPEGGPTLAIAEIMYNPPAPPDGVDGVPDDFEFTEIINPGNDDVDLSFIAFSDGIVFDFADSAVTTLAPGERVVVVKDLAAFEARYGTGLPVAGQYTGSLANDGETLAMTAAGLPFLSITYDDADNWPGRADGRGASLERADFGIDPNDDDAWRSSTEYGGSPGVAGVGPVVDVVVNEVLTHTDVDPTDSIELLNVSGAAVDLGGWFLSDTWETYRKFRIPDGTVLLPGEYLVFDEYDFNAGGLPTDFALDGAHGEDVWLMAADSAGALLRFVDHVEFGAAFRNESHGRWPDGAGELYPMTSLTLGGPNAGPRLPGVVISEIMYNPGSVEPFDREFVEIHNRTGAEVDLTDWRLDKGVAYDFDPGTTLAADARLVVLSFNPDNVDNAARVADFRDAYGIDGSVRLVGGWGGRLDNAGERLELQRPDNPPSDEPYYTPHIIEDAVTYDDLAPWPTGADGDGDALHRAAGRNWGPDPLNWVAGAPSPGAGSDLRPGDADGDGDVDLDDFAILKQHFGLNDMTQAEGDFDGDGDVDLDDFAILKLHFGT